MLKTNNLRTIVLYIIKKGNNLAFWELQHRTSNRHLQIMFKQVKDLRDESIQQMQVAGELLRTKLKIFLVTDCHL